MSSTGEISSGFLLCSKPTNLSYQNSADDHVYIYIYYIQATSRKNSQRNSFMGRSQSSGILHSFGMEGFQSRLGLDHSTKASSPDVFAPVKIFEDREQVCINSCIVDLHLSKLLALCLSFWDRNTKPQGCLGWRLQSLLINLVNLIRQPSRICPWLVTAQLKIDLALQLSPMEN